jgi:hypothetical protein
MNTALLGSIRALSAREHAIFPHIERALCSIDRSSNEDNRNRPEPAALKMRFKKEQRRSLVDDEQREAGIA